MKYITKILEKQDLMTYDEYKSYLISETKKQEEDYENLLFFNFKKYDRFSRYLDKGRLASTKKKLKILQTEVDYNYGFDGCKYDNYTYTLIKFDYKYNTDFYNKFKSIKWEDDLNKKYKFIKDFYEEYRKFFINVSTNKLESKKVRKIIYDVLVFIKEKKRITKSEIDRRKKELKESNNVKNERKFLEEDVNDSFITLNEYNINNYDLEDVLLSYRHIIRCENITNNLVTYLLIIVKRLVEEEIKEEDFELLHSILDSIKYRKPLLNSNELNERKILNMCSSYIKEYIELTKISEYEEEEPHDYKFDIVFELLKDKNNYPVIKNLMNRYPQIVNIRNDKRSILIYILSLYLDNYKMILEDHKYYYNIDYVKEVYRLFSNSNSLYLSYEEEKLLDDIIDRFINEVDELEINSKRKNYAINEVLNLKQSNVKKDKMYFKNVDKVSFDANVRDIEFYDFNHSKRPSEIDLTDEHTFMLHDPYTCYSYNEGKGVKSLKIHTSDISNLVEEGSDLDNYIYNCLLKNKKIKEDVLSYLRFKEGDIVSALTYEIIFDNDREIKGFKMYRSRIKVDGDILDYQNNEYIYKNLRRISNDYIQKYGDVNLSGLSKIEYFLNSLLQKEFVKCTRKNELPLLALKKKEAPSLSPEVLSNILRMFINLDRSDYKRLSRIFETGIEEYYYDNQVRLNEEYNLNLTGTPNYINLMNQRMIKELVNNELRFSPKMACMQREKTILRYTDLKNTMNDILNYKSDIDFDYKKRRNCKRYIYSEE